MLYRFDEFTLTIGNAIVCDSLSGTAEIICDGDYWEVGEIILDTVTDNKVTRTKILNFDDEPMLAQAIRLQVIKQIDANAIDELLAEERPSRRRSLGYGHLQRELL